MITLYHCHAARSFRPLWMLEEMGLPYDLKMLPFPPRVFAKEYLSQRRGLLATPAATRRLQKGGRRGRTRRRAAEGGSPPRRVNSRGGSVFSGSMLRIGLEWRYG
jgi:hypothetical protein